MGKNLDINVIEHLCGVLRCTCLSLLFFPLKRECWGTMLEDGSSSSTAFHGVHAYPLTDREETLPLPLPRTSSCANSMNVLAETRKAQRLVANIERLRGDESMKGLGLQDEKGGRGRRRRTHPSAVLEDVELAREADGVSVLIRRPCSVLGHPLVAVAALEGD